MHIFCCTAAAAAASISGGCAAKKTGLFINIKAPAAHYHHRERNTPLMHDRKIKAIFCLNHQEELNTGDVM